MIAVWEMIWFNPFLILLIAVIAPRVRPSSSLTTKAAAALEKCLRAREKDAKFDQDKKGPSFCAGLIYDSIGEIDEAINMYKAAIEGCSDNEDAWYRLAMVLEKKVSINSLDSAGNGEPLNEEVKRCYSKAIDLYSNSKESSGKQVVALTIKLSQFFLKLDQLELSLRNTEDGLKKGDVLQFTVEDVASLQLIRAGALSRLGRYNDVLDANQEVLRLLPPSCVILNGAALAAEKCGQFNLAEEYFIQSLSLNESHANTHTNYAIFLKSMGKGSRDQEAKILLMKAIELDPDLVESETSHAKIQLASMTPGGLFVDSMDRSYVEGLFDGFSAKFEKDLVGDLGYVGHELVAKLLLESGIFTTNSDTTTVRVLDIGCGTGLFGAALHRMYCGSSPLSITGVDLSSRMLQQAQSNHRAEYSSLIHADANAFLDGIVGGDPVDAVASSDVLIYIGELDRLFAGVQAVLRPGGCFAFTIEVMPESHPLSSSDEGEEGGEEAKQKKGYWLLESGRFGHSPDYIEGMAVKHGYTLKAKESTTIRMQNQQPVPSMTYCLEKKETSL